MNPLSCPVCLSTGVCRNTVKETEKFTKGHISMRDDCRVNQKCQQFPGCAAFFQITFGPSGQKAPVSGLTVRTSHIIVGLLTRCFAKAQNSLTARRSDRLCFKPFNPRGASGARCMDSASAWRPRMAAAFWLPAGAEAARFCPPKWQARPFCKAETRPMHGELGAKGGFYLLKMRGKHAAAVPDSEKQPL